MLVRQPRTRQHTGDDENPCRVCGWVPYTPAAASRIGHPHPGAPGDDRRHVDAQLQGGRREEGRCGFLDSRFRSRFAFCGWAVTECKARKGEAEEYRSKAQVASGLTYRPGSSRGGRKGGAGAAQAVSRRPSPPTVKRTWGPCGCLDTGWPQRNCPATPAQPPHQHVRAAVRQPQSRVPRWSAGAGGARTAVEAPAPSGHWALRLTCYGSSIELPSPPSRPPRCYRVSRYIIYPPPNRHTNTAHYLTLHPAASHPQWEVNCGEQPQRTRGLLPI